MRTSTGFFLSFSFFGVGVDEAAVAGGDRDGNGFDAGDGGEICCDDEFDNLPLLFDFLKEKNLGTDDSGDAGESESDGGITSTSVAGLSTSFVPSQNFFHSMDSLTLLVVPPGVTTILVFPSKLSLGEVPL